MARSSGGPDCRAASIVDRIELPNETRDPAFREFAPVGGDRLPLETHVELAFSRSDATRYDHAHVHLCDRFPEDDGSGVLWTAVHGRESRGDYESLLLQYPRRRASRTTKTMLRRMLNAGASQIGGSPISSLRLQCLAFAARRDVASAPRGVDGSPLAAVARECAMYHCASYDDARLPVFGFEPISHEDGGSWDDSFIPFCPSLNEHLSAWLDGVDLFGAA